MRRTPPVRVQLQPQPAVQGLVAAIVTLAVAGLAAWVCSHLPSAWPVWLALPFAAALAWQQAAVEPGLLRWDGQAWWLSSLRTDEAEIVVELAVLIDLDDWLLLRAVPGARWLPLSRSQQAGQWGALRATLFAAPGGAAR